MLQNLTQLPGYRLYEYLLVVNPHEELSHRIIKIKDEFSEKYKTGNTKSTKPHISLVKFINYQLMEERIMHRFQTIAMGVAPFKVELKDFGSFPTHTIFINVITKLPVQNLVKEEAIDNLVKHVSKDYSQSMDLELSAYIAVIEDGTSSIN